MYVCMYVCMYDWTKTLSLSSFISLNCPFHEWNNWSNAFHLPLYDSSIGSLYELGKSSQRNRIIIVLYTSCMYVYMYVCIWKKKMMIYNINLIINLMHIKICIKIEQKQKPKTNIQTNKNKQKTNIQNQKYRKCISRTFSSNNDSRRIYIAFNLAYKSSWSQPKIKQK